MVIPSVLGRELFDQPSYVPNTTNLGCFLKYYTNIVYIHRSKLSTPCFRLNE